MASVVWQCRQLMPDGPDVEQRGLGRRIHEEVQIAFLGIAALGDRAEDAGVGGVVPGHDLADREAVQRQGL